MLVTTVFCYFKMHIFHGWKRCDFVFSLIFINKSFLQHLFHVWSMFSLSQVGGWGM